MFLDKKLLIGKEEGWSIPSELHSCWNVKGLYSPTQFVLRLRPDIHNELQSINPGIRSTGELNSQQIQAFSTYFHETIHWWQHIGSTLGLMLSLAYPAQAHINNNDLKKLIHDIGPIKSLLKYNAVNDYLLTNESNSRINRILNNWHDIEFFVRLAIDPKKATNVVNSPYFESIGHSYNMAWSSVLWLLSSTLDNNFSFLPDIKNWEQEFKQLNENKVSGYYYGSDIQLPPIGAREIFEGQARFSQLQYLYLSSGREISWDEFEHAGMFTQLYIEAFEVFLEILETPWPETPEDSLVGLFLLVCDLAINPTDGFPFDLNHFSSFVFSVDPGMRFLMLCKSIKNENPNLVNSIRNYTKEEYLEVSEILCSYIVCKTPFSASEKLCEWADTYCNKLMEEDSSFNFSSENLPIRLLFAKFLRFQQDKLIVPEFFCWPGILSVGERKSGISLDTALELFESHKALFCDDVDGDIYPSAFPDKDDQSIQNTFNSFYFWNMTYDMTRQWIIQDGSFEYDYSWLTSKYSKSEVANLVRDQFRHVYGIDPSKFKII